MKLHAIHDYSSLYELYTFAGRELYHCDNDSQITASGLQVVLCFMEYKFHG